jgi:purine-nucleoside phosphorylase
VSRVAGHPGVWIAGCLAALPIAVLAGRAHLYEGFPAAEVAFAVRVLGLLGVRSLVLTNAAGGTNESWAPGDIVMIRDHLNLQAVSPLGGPHDERFGPRFPDMSEPYSGRFRAIAREEGAALGIQLPEGVYAGLLGPNYETPAEIRAIRSLGADLVGMSTVQETIAASQMRIEVLGLSLVTNRAAGLGSGPLSHDEVLRVTAAAAARLSSLLARVLPRLA